MTKHFLFYLLSTGLIFSAVPGQGQWSLEAETGVVIPGYNDIRVPGNTGTLVSFSDELDTPSKLFYRLRLSYEWQDKHYFSLLYAPLQLRAEGTLEEELLFQGTRFAPEASLTGTYQFNSYRFTYRYGFPRTERFQFGLGATAKIRDAAIAISAENQSARKTNVGFVPLIHFHLEWIARERLTLLLQGDALAAPQGRAEDVILAALLYPSKNITLKLGYRVLEGGADNEEVYNFTLLHYAVIGGIVTF